MSSKHDSDNIIEKNKSESKKSFIDKILSPWKEQNVYYKIITILLTILVLVPASFIGLIIIFIPIALVSELLTSIFGLNNDTSLLVASLLLVILSLAILLITKGSWNKDFFSSICGLSIGFLLFFCIMRLPIKWPLEIIPIILSLVVMGIISVLIAGYLEDFKGIRKRHLKRAKNVDAQHLYTEYLNSEHWKITREKALANAGYKCQLCNSSKEPLNVHHRTYEHIGNELDSDLIVLCEDCHHLFHKQSNIT